MHEKIMMQALDKNAEMAATCGERAAKNRCARSCSMSEKRAGTIMMGSNGSKIQ